MFNAVIKRAALGCLTIAALTACNGNNEQTEAQALYDSASAQIENKAYAQALETLDSLDAKYKMQAEIRRKGLNLREKAIEAITMDSISECDLRLAKAKLAVDSLGKFMQHIDGTAGLEGHYTPKAIIKKQLLNASTIEPRVDEQGYFFIVANVNGKTIGLNSLVFKSSNGQFTAPSSPVAADRAIKVEDSEVLSFTQEEMAEAADWLDVNRAVSQCVLTGSKGSVPVKLSQQQVSAIADAWHFAQALQEQRLSSIKREKLERKLQTARDHIANLYDGDDDSQAE
jgi:hypothetical protein